MTIHVNLGEARARLSQLVAASLRGEQVILARAGKPLAQIVGLETAPAQTVDRARRMKAFIGSFRTSFPAEADALFDTPEFGDTELDGFEATLKP